MRGLVPHYGQADFAFSSFVCFLTSSFREKSRRNFTGTREKAALQRKDGQKAALRNYPLLQSTMQEQIKLKPKPSK